MNYPTHCQSHEGYYVQSCPECRQLRFQQSVLDRLEKLEKPSVKPTTLSGKTTMVIKTALHHLVREHSTYLGDIYRDALDEFAAFCAQEEKKQ